MTNKFFKKAECEKVQCEIIDDEVKILDVEEFQEIFNPLEKKKIVTINLEEVEGKIRKLKTVKDVKIFKSQKNICVKVRPNKILGIAYYNFVPTEDNVDEQSGPEFILDNGEKIFFKIKEGINFIPVILEEKDVQLEKLLPILKFINSNDKIKSIINTISIKENNFYLTTIFNDSRVNLGSFFDQKSIIYKICNMHKIIYLSNDFPCIEFNDETLFLHKKRV